MEKINKTEEDWKKELTHEQYKIMREKGTEPAFTGKYYQSKEDGTYKCADCGNLLFSSDAKFDSGTGLPIFYKPISEGSVEYETDNSFSVQRKEIKCGRCGAHLGHVFDDGPNPTGKRYCLNSVCLDLEKKKE